MSRKNQEFDFEIPDQQKSSRSANDNQNVDDSEGSYKRLLQGKDITWFWLMQHYSKENAAAYKAQKAAKKALKESKKKMNDDAGQEKSLQQESAGKGNFSEKPHAYERAENDHSTENSRLHERDNRHENRYPCYDDLSNGDEDDFGKTVSLGHKRKTADQSYPRAELECVGFGRTVPLKHFPFRIGRSTENVELCIADNKAIGRRHAEIHKEGSHYYIVDLNSCNHTYINGREIPADFRTEIFDQDRIELADEPFVFHVYMDSGSC